MDLMLKIGLLITIVVTTSAFGSDLKNLIEQVEIANIDPAPLAGPPDDTALLRAIYLFDTAEVQRLLASGVDPNAGADLGNRPVLGHSWSGPFFGGFVT